MINDVRTSSVHITQSMVHTAVFIQFLPVLRSFPLHHMGEAPAMRLKQLYQVGNMLQDCEFLMHLTSGVLETLIRVCRRCKPTVCCFRFVLVSDTGMHDPWR